jgi:diphthamide synthase (EF-2-diphthine--ammonia ligase)
MPEPPPPSRPVDFEQPRLDCQPREPLRPQAAGESRLTWRRKRSAGILRQVAKAAGVDRKAEEVVGGLTARVEAVLGDLFLEDVREYRIRMLSGTGLEPLFPLWCSPAGTPDLARRMLGGGLRAVLTCVDPKQLAEPFVGRPYDAAFLAELPPGVDPCGERGEFHTFCFAGPMFASEIAVQVGETVSRHGFRFADLV